MRRAVLLLVALLVLALGRAACVDRDRIPLADDRLEQVLVDADAWTIYALNPDAREEGQVFERQFHGWEVLGEATLHEPDERLRLSRSLGAGIRAGSWTAMCFDPRHGIRATSETGTVDLVICFTCFSVRVYDGETGVRVEGEQTTDTPCATFDEIFAAAGLQIAD